MGAALPADWRRPADADEKTSVRGPATQSQLPRLDGDDAPYDQLVADIIQCGHAEGKALRIDSLDDRPTTPKRNLLILFGLEGWLGALDDFRNWLIREAA